MEVVCNASPLISLSKLGRVDILHIVFDKILVPEEVWQEVVIRGKQDFPTEASRVEDACAQGWLRCMSCDLPTTSRTGMYPELDRGEAEVILLAKQQNVSTVLIDDAAGRKVAESLGLKVRGTLFILAEACRRRKISTSDAEDILNRLVHAGFRLGPEVYAESLREIRLLR